MTTATQNILDKWESRIENSGRITRMEWQEFIRETTPESPAYTVQLVHDTRESDWFCHDPRGNGDASFGDCGLYRASIQARLIHPSAEIIIAN